MAKKEENFSLEEGFSMLEKTVEELEKEEKSLLAWLTALRMYMKESEYLNFLTEHPDYYETSLCVERKMLSLVL